MHLVLVPPAANLIIANAAFDAISATTATFVAAAFVILMTVFAVEETIFNSVVAYFTPSSMV